MIRYWTIRANYVSLLHSERLGLINKVQFGISIRDSRLPRKEECVAFTSLLRIVLTGPLCGLIEHFSAEFPRVPGIAKRPRDRPRESRAPGKSRGSIQGERGDADELSEVLTRIDGDSLFTGRIEPGDGRIPCYGVPKARIFHRRFPFVSCQTGYSDKQIKHCTSVNLK